MKLIQNILKDEFKKVVKKAFPEFDKWESLDIEKATDPKFGDFQTNFAMVNAKTFRNSPVNIANKIKENFNKTNFDIIKEISVAGPGFINIIINSDYLSKYLKKIGKQKYDFSFLDKEGKVIIDYSSPNIAKRMHIGHLRSTVIGDSIKRMYDFLGYDTVADNHLGDWGTHFGKLIVAYNKWLDKKNYENNPLKEMERLYVKFNQEAEKNKKLNDDARKELKKLQTGNKENKKLWEDFIDKSMNEYQKMYDILDINFDYYHGESFYQDIMDDIIKILKEKKVAEKDDGALVVFFEEEELHPCIVQKKDGSYNYATSELATIKYRRDNFNVNRLLYVTDDRQKTHFTQIFKIAEKLGWNERYEFISFGVMSYNGQAFSSRKGNIILMKDFIEEAVSRAKEIVEEKNPELNENKKQEIAEKVGIGAIKYADLSQNRVSDINFDWDEVLSFEGNTAPYLQYVYVRINSLYNKAKDRNITVSNDDKLFLKNQTEKQLAVKITQFPDKIVKASKYYKPNIIADYLFRLAQQFNKFYNSLPILREDEIVTKSRLLLCSKVSYVIKTGLNLLGIKTVNRM